MELKIFEENGEFVFRRKGISGRIFEQRFITKKGMFEKLEEYKILLCFENFIFDVSESLSTEVFQFLTNVEKNQY
jgi:hypothetical protein